MLDFSSPPVVVVNELRPDRCDAYVGAAAELTGMSLRLERVAPVAAVIDRIAGFAADLESFALGDDVDIAGKFAP